jgi:hypothetical protein
MRRLRSCPCGTGGEHQNELYTPPGVVSLLICSGQGDPGRRFW